MGFFEGAHGFVIHSAEMNDVGGDYNRTEITTRVTNSDVGNRYVASVVNKGNTETHPVTIRGGNKNVISVHGQHRVNGNVQLNDLQNALQALPGISLSGGVQDPLQLATAIQGALQSLPVNSTSPDGPLTSTLLAGSTYPNTSTLMELPSVSSTSSNAESISTVTKPLSVGGGPSDGTVITAMPSTPATAPPAAASVDESLPKESSPPRVETALVVPPQARNAVESAMTETNVVKANENIQASPLPATQQPKQRKKIFTTLVSNVRARFK